MFKKWIDRRLIRLILTPLTRALIAALVGYLASKGVPADQIEQLTLALGAVGAIAFNICWELIDRRKAENNAVRSLLGSLDLRNPDEAVR